MPHEKRLRTKIALPLCECYVLRKLPSCDEDYRLNKSDIKSC